MDDAAKGEVSHHSRTEEVARHFHEIMAEGAGAVVALHGGVEVARDPALHPENVLAAVVSTMLAGHGLEAQQTLSASGEVVILVSASERPASHEGEILLEPPGLAAMERLFSESRRQPMVLVGGGRSVGRAMADALDLAALDLDRPDRKSWETPYGPPRRGRNRGGP